MLFLGNISVLIIIEKDVFRYFFVLILIHSYSLAVFVISVDNVACDSFAVVENGFFFLTVFIIIINSL